MTRFINLVMVADHAFQRSWVYYFFFFFFTNQLVLGRCLFEYK